MRENGESNIRLPERHAKFSGQGCFEESAATRVEIYIDANGQVRGVVVQTSTSRKSSTQCAPERQSTPSVTSALAEMKARLRSAAMAVLAVFYAGFKSMKALFEFLD